MTAAGGQRSANRVAWGPRGGGLVILVLFLLRVGDWFLSELWFDEIITLNDFVIGPPGHAFANVFTRYTVANNHPLFSAVGWVWLRLLGMHLNEFLLRLPSLAFSLCALLAILFSWQRWLGKRGAAVCALVMAFSPVYAAFAWQFRGYALAMFLSVLAVSGAMWWREGSRLHGGLLLGSALLCLPATIPANLVLAASLLLFVAFCQPGPSACNKRLKHALQCWPLALAVVAGCMPYFIVWHKFRKVMSQTDGWESGLLVAGHWGLAVLAHGGAVIVLAAVWWFTSDRQGSRSAVRASLQWGACLLLPAAVALGVSDPAPFPRVFLPLLPPLTFAAFLAFRDTGVWSRYSALVLLGAVLVNGFVWERAGTYLARKRMRAGKYPQNLLQQYYRGSESIRTSMRSLAETMPSVEGLMAISTFHDVLTVRYYLQLEGVPVSNVAAPGWNLDPGWLRRARDPEMNVVAIALTAERARQLMRKTGRVSKRLRVRKAGMRTMLISTPFLRQGSNGSARE